MAYASFLRGAAVSEPLSESRQPASVTSDFEPDDVRDLWLRMLRRGWKSLALVPAAPAGSTQKLARAICSVGAIYRGRGLPLLSASDLTLDSVNPFIYAMSRVGKSQTDQDEEEKLVVMLDSVITNPLGIAVALASDAVLLVIELGKTDERSARRTVELIGRDRFIGSVALK